MNINLADTLFAGKSFGYGISFGETDHSQFNLLLDSLDTNLLKTRYSKLQNFVEKHPGFNPAYQVLFSLYFFEGQLEEAKSYFEKLSHSYDHKQNCHWILAKIYLQKKNDEAAFDAYVWALRAGPPSIALLKDFIEFDHNHRGKFKGSDFIRKLELEPQLSKVVSALYAYVEFQDKKTIKLLHEAQKIKDTIFQDLTILHMLGYSYFSLNQYSKVDSIWQAGLRKSDSENNLAYKLLFLSNLGYLKQSLGDADLAVSYYDSAYSVSIRTNNRNQIQKLGGRLAFIKMNGGDFIEAEVLFKKAIKNARKLNEKSDLADWYRGYAMTLFYLGKYSQALGRITEAERLLKDTAYVERIIKTKLDKASILMFLKQLVLARRTLNELIRMAKKSGLTYYHEWAKARLGDIFRLQGEYSKAIQHYTTFISYLETNDDLSNLSYEWHGRLARTYLTLENYGPAHIEYLKALEIARRAKAKTFEGWYLVRLADIAVIRNELDLAFENYGSASKIAKKQKNQDMLWEISLGYGNAHKKMRDISSAISAYQQAAQLLESTRNELNIDRLRVGYFIEGFQIYQNLVDCYQTLYLHDQTESYLDSVFYYHELGRGRGLSELVEDKKSESHGEGYGKIRQQIQTVQHTLREKANHWQDRAGLDGLLLELEAAKYSLISEQLGAGGDATSNQTAVLPKVRPLKSVLKYLKRSHLGMLLYHIAEERSFVLASDGSEVQIIPLQTVPDSLTAKVNLLVTPFHGVHQDFVNSVPFQAGIAFQLYKILVQPVESAMTLPNNIVIIPDAALLNLPFAMLLTKKQDFQEFTPADYPSYAQHFLQNRYSFVYSPTTSVLREKSSRSGSPKTLVFANPFDAPPIPDDAHRLRSRVGWRFAPLKYAQKEAKEIAQLAPDSRILQLNNATESTLMKEASDYDVIHFATHAFVDTVFDDFSGVVLAAGEDSTTDGILNAFEISELNLDCELVTLSACETGRGKQVVGEGVLGLPRQFLAAGAKSVLMTHWKVDDRFASILMPEFYRFYLKEGLSKTEALNRAKRHLLSTIDDKSGFHYQHPVYWASFTLYGDPGMARESSHAVYLAVLVVMMACVIVVAKFRKSTSSVK